MARHGGREESTAIKAAAHAVRHQRLGVAQHTEDLIFMNTYSHLWPDSDDRTPEAVDLVLADFLADSVRTDALP